MTDEQRQALKNLDRAIKGWEKALARTLIATQAMDLAMADCRRVNNVNGTRTTAVRTGRDRQYGLKGMG